MAHSAEINIVVLWDTELKIAAKALDRFTMAVREDSADSEDQVIKYANEALDACLVALRGIADDSALIVFTAPEGKP